jgi:hypothetical protein
MQTGPATENSQAFLDQPAHVLVHLCTRALIVSPFNRTAAIIFALVETLPRRSQSHHQSAFEQVASAHLAVRQMPQSLVCIIASFIKVDLRSSRTSGQFNEKIENVAKKQPNVILPPSMKQSKHGVKKRLIDGAMTDPRVLGPGIKGRRIAVRSKVS